MKQDIILSASKIKTAKSCSMKYFGSYILKLPDTSNDGAQMGDLSHIVLECLAEPRRRNIAELLIHKKDAFSYPSVERLIRKIAKRNGVETDEHIEKIRGFILNGLCSDFFGERDGIPDKSMTEQEFKIEVDDDNLKYKIRGFIDRLFIYGDRALVRDYKTSKSTFQGEDLHDNIQAIAYCLAVTRLFPHIQTFDVEFLFLKFDCEVESLWETRLFRGAQTKGEFHNGGGKVTLSFSREEIDGFQWELSGIQAYLEAFTEDNSQDNLAKFKAMPTDGTFSGPLMCGRATHPEELKKDGTKMWHCPYKFSFDYFCVVDHNTGQTVKSSFEDELEDLKSWLATNPKKAELVLKKRRFNGCPAFEHLQS